MCEVVVVVQFVYGWSGERSLKYSYGKGSENESGW